MTSEGFLSVVGVHKIVSYSNTCMTLGGWSDDASNNVRQCTGVGNELLHM